MLARQLWSSGCQLLLLLLLLQPMIVFPQQEGLLLGELLPVLVLGCWTLS